ncbi:MAG TPA: hypothetical protein VIK02_08425 [Candidatus Anoxymicrobiaceae bacterium]
MKKAVAVVMVSVIVAVAFAAAGCGGDASAARSDMNKGDAALKTVEGRYTTISQRTTKLITEYVAGTNTERAGVRAQVGDIKGLLDQAAKGQEAARSEYRKILSLSGVPDYAKYAGLQIQVIDKLAKANAGIRAMVEIIQASSDSGQPPDVQKITALSEDIQALTTQIDALMKQANDLKVSKKLA